jgi:NAD(P)-dependent dehydrogenase (short-subunit alcohol dehydrogenase family)
MRFKDKVAVVIGGNSGIGLAAAQAFAAEGAKLVITGRDPSTLDSAASQLGPGTLALRADVADLAATDRVMQAVRERHGRIDALLVNAGVGTFAPVREVTELLWDQVHGINLKGCFFAAQKALPLMGRGSAIVFTGSIGSVLALPGNSIYAAAKAGLRAAARILAAELVETPILRRNVGMDPAVEHALRQQMIAHTPMKRMGEANEIAKAVLFLASSDASFITGVDLFVDGGVLEL